MDLMEKVAGRCQVRDRDVDIYFIKLKKNKMKQGAKTPIRCHCSAECPRSTFCKFVNPLTNHIPVDFGDGKSAEAS